MALEMLEVANFSPEQAKQHTRHKISNLDLTATVAKKENEGPSEQTKAKDTSITNTMMHQAEQSGLQELIQQNKWCKFFGNCLFWTRILVLILTIFLFCLSLSYSTAQLLEAKLDLITDCGVPKTREEIWWHSYESSLKYPPDQKLNDESQVLIYSYT